MVIPPLTTSHNEHLGSEDESDAWIADAYFSIEYEESAATLHENPYSFSSENDSVQEYIDSISNNSLANQEKKPVLK